MKKLLFFTLLLPGICPQMSHAQKLLETGGQKMPDEWIDKETHHKVIRLTRCGGSNHSFYFHNNPFVGNDFIFYHTAAKEEGNDMQADGRQPGRQLWKENINTLKASALTHHAGKISGEIVCPTSNETFYQIHDSVFATNITTTKERLIFVFPKDFKGDITSINANGTLLAGAIGTEAENEIFKNNPKKSDFFNKVFEARLPRSLFTVSTQTGKINKIFTDSAWLNHVQFSPTDPNLLMFCHEGPWHKVDRIWTINVQTKEVKLVYKRTVDMEIAGHEWFAADGKTIWYDLQQPKGATFFVGGTSIATGKEMKYALQRNEWSVHYNSSPDGKLFAGDGGDPGAVAKAPNGQWIYLFTPAGNHFNAEKLVSLQHHNYKLEPNVHFSPDRQWIIFRANFEGQEDVYAVSVKKQNN